MSITLYQFRLLSNHEQADYLWENGVHIDKRFEPGIKVMLYQVDSFYVEVYYNGTSNLIEKLRPFISSGPLEPYLQKISLESLVSGKP